MKFPLIDVLPSVVGNTPPSEVLPLAIKYCRPAHSPCAMFATVTVAFSFAEVLCLLWSPDLGFVDRSFLCECTNGQCHPNLHRCVSKYREQGGLSIVAFPLGRSSTGGDLLGCKGFFPTFWRLILVPCRSPSSYGLTRKSTIDCLVPLLSFADTATAVPFGRSRTCAVDSPRCQSPLLSIFDNDGFFLENHVLLVQWQHFLQRQHFFICRSWKVSRTHPSKSSPRANSASSHY